MAATTTSWHRRATVTMESSNGFVSAPDGLSPSGCQTHRRATAQFAPTRSALVIPSCRDHCGMPQSTRMPVVPLCQIGRGGGTDSEGCQPASEPPPTQSQCTAPARPVPVSLAVDSQSDRKQRPVTRASARGPAGTAAAGRARGRATQPVRVTVPLALAVALGGLPVAASVAVSQCQRLAA
jgi:hypothetical protein